MYKSRLFKIAVLILVIIAIVSIVYLFLKSTRTTKNIISFPGIHFIKQPNNFHVLTTSPQNGQTNVSAGEIPITFTTDNPINSNKQFNITISPPLPFYWKITNNYPTNLVRAQILGGLKTNTLYTVKITDADNKPVYQWHFRTTAQPPVSSYLYVRDQAQKIIRNQFPLLPYLPFSNNDFYIDYTGPNNNTLEVDIENPNITSDQIKQEVNYWIRSHGIDPSTQKINYVNDF